MGEKIVQIQQKSLKIENNLNVELVSTCHFL